MAEENGRYPPSSQAPSEMPLVADVREYAQFLQQKTRQAWMPLIALPGMWPEHAVSLFSNVPAAMNYADSSTKPSSKIIMQ